MLLVACKDVETAAVSVVLGLCGDASGQEGLQPENSCKPASGYQRKLVFDTSDCVIARLYIIDC